MIEELKFEFDLPDEFLPEIVEEILEEETPKQVKIKAKREPKHYINNADFCEALILYKSKCAENELLGLPKPRIPNYIGECFMKLAEGLSRRPNFFGYSYRDEMVSDGIENCLMYFHNFNTEKKNPFAYFTQILWWCFVRRIQKEKKQQYIKYKATENFGILDTAELMELGFGEIKQIEVYNNMYDFISKFEETEFKKVNKNQELKVEKLSGLELFLD